jgi:hypothetical protein
MCQSINNYLKSIVMSKVIVKAFQDGAVLRPSSKAEGRVILMIAETSLSNVGGAYFESSRRAIINLPEGVANQFNLKDGDDFNAKLKSFGQNEVEIIREESTTPFYEGQNPKVNPTSQEIVRTSSGEAIYMRDKAYDKGTEKDKLVKSAGQSLATESEAHAEKGDLA